jgi:hypothetical protein
MKSFTSTYHSGSNWKFLRVFNDEFSEFSELYRLAEYELTKLYLADIVHENRMHFA